MRDGGRRSIARQSVQQVERRRGPFVHSAANGVLAGFASVVEAVNCAAGISARAQIENLKIALKRRPEFRIGVNFGDV